MRVSGNQEKINIKNLCTCFGITVLLLSGCRVGEPEAGQSIADAMPAESSSRLPADTVTYRHVGTQRALDVYPAQGDNPSGIALLLVHGGSWVRGDRFSSIQTPMFQYLLSAGHVVFSIDYTLARISGVVGDPADCTQTAASFPNNLEDVKWAIGWANQPSIKALYGYDRVVVVGESSGGQLAGLANVTSDQKPEAIPAEYDIRPDAAVTLVAPMDMTTWGAQGGLEYFQNFIAFFTSLDTLGDPNPIQCLFGPQYNTVFDVPIAARESASAHLHVDISDPPIYMVSGTADAAALPQYNADVLEQAYVDLIPGHNGHAWNDRIEHGLHNASHIGTNTAMLDTFLSGVANGQWD